MMPSIHKLHAIFFSTKNTSIQELIELHQLDLDYFTSYEFISTKNFKNNEDFFLIYKLLSTSFIKNRNLNILFINIDNIEVNAIIDFIILTNDHEVLYLREGIKNLNKPQKTPRPQLCQSPLTPPLLYMSSKAIAEDAIIDSNLLSYGLWDLLLATESDIYSVMLESRSEHKTNVIEDYKNYLLSTSHPFTEDLPDSLNEWLNLKKTLHTAVIDKHLAKFSGCLSTIMTNIDNANYLLERKVKTTKSELKHQKKQFLARHNQDSEDHKLEMQDLKDHYENNQWYRRLIIETKNKLRSFFKS